MKENYEKNIKSKIEEIFKVEDITVRLIPIYCSENLDYYGLFICGNNDVVRLGIDDFGLMLNIIRKLKFDNIREVLFENFTFQTDIVLNNMAEVLKVTFIKCKFDTAIIKNIKGFKLYNCFEFKKCYFLKKIKFNKQIFKENIIFKDCFFKSSCFITSNIFEKFTDISGNMFENRTFLCYNEFGYVVDFSKNVFLKNVYFNNSKFLNYVRFNGCNFEQDIAFNSVEFDEEIHFKNFIFNKNIDFSNTKFKGDAYFNNSVFKDFANFQESQFDKVANFFGVTFKNIMNFSSAYFKDFNKAIFINLNIDEINKYVIKNCNENLCKVSDNKIIDINTFRDSFRAIKHSLMSVNNTLEASKFHKLELYAKEIELEYLQEIKKNNAKKEKQKSADNEEKAKKITFKEIVDRYILSIYRKTSEHHTNFIKILNFTVFMIAMFGAVAFLVDLSFKHIDLSKFYNFTYFEILIVLFIMFYSVMILLGLVWLFRYRLIIILSYIGTFLMLVITPASIVPFFNLGSIDSHKFTNEYLDRNLMKDEFSELSIKFLDKNSTNLADKLATKKLFIENTKMFMDYNYTEELSILATKELENIKTAIKKDEIRNDTMKSLNFIYMIVLGLCLYSLQKTARRNSIVLG
ncbi:MAG: hypothetical protein GX282_02260 [Campylobacteraceae bacterium]|nr:hypothetical protein [Campylobacteraceae bacterium]